MSDTLNFKFFIPVVLKPQHKFARERRLWNGVGSREVPTRRFGLAGEMKRLNVAYSHQLNDFNDYLIDIYI